MSMLAIVLTALVAVLHLGFMVLEMVFWTRPLGRRVFGLDPQVARDSAKLAMNQGLYNGFLAAGLLWGLWLDARGITLFFLGCVVVAGLFGAATVKRSILYVQALPPCWPPSPSTTSESRRVGAPSGANLLPLASGQAGRRFVLLARVEAPRIRPGRHAASTSL